VGLQTQGPEITGVTTPTSALVTAARAHNEQWNKGAHAWQSVTWWVFAVEQRGYLGTQQHTFFLQKGRWLPWSCHAHEVCHVTGLWRQLDVLQVTGGAL
jgi:hypothetical protein